MVLFVIASAGHFTVCVFVFAVLHANFVAHVIGATANMLLDQRVLGKLCPTSLRLGPNVL